MILVGSSLHASSLVHPDNSYCSWYPRSTSVKNTSNQHDDNQTTSTLSIRDRQSPPNESLAQLSTHIIQRQKQQHTTPPNYVMEEWSYSYAVSWLDEYARKNNWIGGFYEQSRPSSEFQRQRRRPASTEKSKVCSELQRTIEAKSTQESINTSLAMQQLG